MPVQDLANELPATDIPATEVDEVEQEVPLIEVLVKHGQQGAFQPIRMPSGTTSEQVAVAEKKLGAFAHNISPRTSMNTPLPLHEPLQEGQRVQLCLPWPEPEVPVNSGAKPQILFPCTRERALWNQQAWVAVDEMQYYVNAVGTEEALDTSEVLRLPTENFEADLTPWVFALIANAQVKPQASAILYKDHWIPVVIHPSPATHIVTTPEGTQLLSDGVADIDVPIHTKVMHSAFAADCGFQAFAWLLGQAQNQDPEVLSPCQADSWRQLFCKFLIGTNSHLTMIEDLDMGGTLQDSHTLIQLCDLLKQHGVWADRVQDRAAVVMQKLGLSQVRSIMSSKRPWADLKAASNHQQPVLKLVMADELEHQIKQRAQAQKAFGKKPAKGRGPPAQPAQITAADLQVPPGVFRQQGGTKLAAIPASQIGPHAQGVVLVDQQDCEATLKITRPVTPHGLAVLVLANQANAAQHMQEPIKFPALCPATQEAILVSGYLYQLGKLEVV